MSVVIRERVLQGIVSDVVEMDAVHRAITVPMVSVMLMVRVARVARLVVLPPQINVVLMLPAQLPAVLISVTRG
jgi:hypothetical protein